MPQDRPTAVELIEAVREFLERDVMTIEGRTGFHGRVARNALAMIQRELELSASLDATNKDLLVTLMGQEFAVQDLKALEAQLARGIRSGEFDDRLDEVAGYVRESVAAKLKVANPDYA